MAKAAGVLFAALAAAALPLHSRNLTACLEDRVGLSAFVADSFRLELQRLVSDGGIGLALVSDAASVRQCVAVVIRETPPSRYESALGVTYRSGARVLPLIEVYTRPVGKLLGRQAHPEALGRALARVAAHELAHYLYQQTEHDAAGLMQPHYRAKELTDAGAAGFLLGRK